MRSDQLPALGAFEGFGGNKTRQRRVEHVNDKRATCRYIEVVPGDGCASLVARCGISAADFTKYNSEPNLCATLVPGAYVCCSSGTSYSPPKPDVPKPNADGTCAAHLIQNGDTCFAIAELNGVTVSDLEKWNRGETWAWTGCQNLILGYNMCLSEGIPPLPPPQQGAQCGPLVSGTMLPKGSSVSMTSLNPCPLNACCSNWGFCGLFSVHCDIHAPAGAGPGSVQKGYGNTCISNCGNKIESNSPPPAAFQRIGYYESFNFKRDCLWLKAKNSNTDGTYTHIHWAFLDIDPKTWKPIVKDDNQQWNDFKALKNVKRIVSFGGWSHSTEPVLFKIIRSAIIDNRDTFAANLAQFAQKESIDGIDIDWEYPGATDILADGQPIGRKGDGIKYLDFLTVLKQKLGADKSLSIAAPASYWYLKEFPIDRIAAVIDYIVCMTYDLHGQWDYGNPNAFDSCASGKCIRSHVNMTETRNALVMITKAGVPNNKIFVGEASYGRSFHMARPDCWGPTCDFTGSRIQSDANTGRCTKTPGYLAAAEINEIIKYGDGAQTFHDANSGSDVMLYKGDYVSYLTPTSKDTRRADWKSLNFAGTIDWAVDLQSFTLDEIETSSNRPSSGTGCISGGDDSVNSGDLCDFSCTYAFCPESLCTCFSTGSMKTLPIEKPENNNAIAWDEFDVDLNRLCNFACKYGHCPDNICSTPSADSDETSDSDSDKPPGFDYAGAREQNSKQCLITRDPSGGADVHEEQCVDVCKAQVDKAKAEDRITSYGCIGSFPLDTGIPWQEISPGNWAVTGKCLCDNETVNWFGGLFIDILTAIGQASCHIFMSTLKIVFEVGTEFIPGPGKAIGVGLDMAISAAKSFAYLYPEEEDPAGAFDFWLSPCGNTDLVPDDLKKTFDILSSVADGIGSWKPPKNLKKGSGKTGDERNPINRGKPLGPRPGGGVQKPGSGTGGKKKCYIAPAQKTIRLGGAKNTLRKQSCVADKTVKEEMIITSLVYAANAVATQVQTHCDKAWSQACFHYSSAIRVNPQWATLTCPPSAATTAHRQNGRATASWSNQHRGAGWLDSQNRQRQDCERDEYPPAYLLDASDPAIVFGGQSPSGQLVRYLPAAENGKAGQMWKGACFQPPLADLSDKDFENAVNRASKGNKQIIQKVGLAQTLAAIPVTLRPEFVISSWGQTGNAPVDDGLPDNPCWPKAIAAQDPAFVLLNFDPRYGGRPPPYDDTKPYKKGSNGS